MAVLRDINRMDKAMDEMRFLNMGGTAIGTGINADKVYLNRIVPNLVEVSGMDFVQAFDLIDATQNLDPFVAVSGAIKACAVTLSKIANDLRLMSSGPRAGFGEINLPPKQNGSSIMPGKVNPVIPEVVNQVAFNVIGNDITITMAAEAGQLELNAFEPIIFYCMFQSIDTLAYAVRTFEDNCVSGITANEERCEELAENSIGLITAISPHVGYQKAADIAKKALKTGKSVRFPDPGRGSDEQRGTGLYPESGQHDGARDLREKFPGEIITVLRAALPDTRCSRPTAGYSRRIPRLHPGSLPQDKDRLRTGIPWLSH